MLRSELRSFVQGLGYGTDTVGQQNIFLLRAYLELAGARDWAWLEAESTTPTIASAAETVTGMPTDISTPKEMYISTSSQVYPRLLYRPKDDFEIYRQGQLSSDRGVPRYWTYLDNSNVIRVFPKSDAAYNVTLFYTRVPVTTEFDDDADVLPFAEEFHMILGWRCAQWLAIRERDFTSAQFFEGNYEKLKRDMEMADRMARTDTHIQRSDYWDQVKPWRPH